MSYHSATIAVYIDGGYKSIYCYNDGYPEHMYKVLTNSYATQERAEALVNLGDASFIGNILEPPADSNHRFYCPRPDTCIFYCRDRFDPWSCCAPLYSTREKLLTSSYHSNYYLYIFENNQWKIYRYGEELVDNENA